MWKMRKTFERFNPSLIFIISALVFIVPLGYYFFFWVPAQRADLTRQYLRSSAMISNLLEKEVENIGTVSRGADFIIDEKDDALIEEDISERIDALFDTPYIKTQFVHLWPGIKKNTAKPLFFTSTLAETTEPFEFTVKKEFFIQNGTRVAEFKIILDPDAFISQVTGGSEFEEVFLVNKSGAIMGEPGKIDTQQSRSGIKLNDLKSFFEKIKSDKNDKTSTPLVKQYIDPTDFLSQVADVDIAGNKYRLFLQPVILHIEGIWNKNYYTTGIISLNEFDKRSRAISNNVLLLFVLLILLALIGFPLLKLRLIGPADGVRLRDILFLSFSFIIGIPVILFFILTVSGYYIDENNARTELENLSKEIQTRFTNELTDAYDQLSILVNERKEYLYPWTGGRLKPTKKPLLEELNTGNKLIYPYFDMAFIAGKEGKQVYVRNTDDRLLSSTPAGNPDLTQKIREKEFLYLPDNRPFSLDPMYSKSTGIYQLNLTIPFTGEPEKTEPPMEAAGICFRPLSVMEPVIPEGYGFVIIDNNGMVTFHSDYRLNGNENFFSECGSRAGLIKATIQSRGKDIIRLPYKNKDSDFFFSPLQDIPWTVAVFRDRAITGSRNLEKIYRASLRYLLYFAALALVISLYFFIIFLYGFLLRITGLCKHKADTKLTWLWPHKNLKFKYFCISFLNIGVFIFLTIDLLLRDKPFRGILVLPLLALILSYVAIQKTLIRMRSTHKPGSRWFMFFRDVIIPLALFLMLILPFAFLTPYLKTVLSQKSFLSGLILFYLFLLFIPNREIENRRIRNWGLYRNSYTIAFYSFILLLLAYPAMVTYKIAFHEENITNVKYHQFTLSRDYTSWQKRLAREYKPQYEVLKDERERRNTRGYYFIPSQKTYIIDKSMVEFLKRTDGNILLMQMNFSSVFNDFIVKEANLFPETIINPRTRPIMGMFLETLGQLIPFDNRYSEKLRHFYNDQSQDGSLTWMNIIAGNLEKEYLRFDEKNELTYREGIKGTEPFYVVSVVPWIRTVKKNLIVLTIGLLAAGFFLVIGLYLAAHYLTKFVFLKETDIAPGESSLVFNNHSRPGPGRILYLGKEPQGFKLDIKPGDLFKVDFSNIPSGGHFNPGFPVDKKTVIIDHFDYKMYDPQFNKTKLEVMERLVYGFDVEIAIFSRYEPMENFKLEEGKETQKEEKKEDSGTTPIIDRWKKVLGSFEYRYFVERDKKSHEHKTGLISGNLPPEAQEIIEFIDDECEGTPYLEPVKKRIAEDLAKLEPSDYKNITLTAWKDRMNEYANDVYNEIWRTCTRDEKLVLIRLAREGLLNPRNKENIRKLMRRQLILHAPLRLICPSFKKFILNVEDFESILEWKKKQYKSIWMEIRQPLMFLVTGVIIFLMATQPGMLESWMVVIPAVSSFIPVLLKLVDQVKSIGGRGE